MDSGGKVRSSALDDCFLHPLLCHSSSVSFADSFSPGEAAGAAAPEQPIHANCREATPSPGEKVARRSRVGRGTAISYGKDAAWTAAEKSDHPPWMTASYIHCCAIPLQSASLTASPQEKRQVLPHRSSQYMRTVAKRSLPPRGRWAGDSRVGRGTAISYGKDAAWTAAEKSDHPPWMTAS